MNAVITTTAVFHEPTTGKFHSRYMTN